MLPACGIYRTSIEIAGIPAGRLIYFHNHGDPGPGLYLPAEWKTNRAVFAKRGTTLTDLDAAHSLEPLPAEGLYRVRSAFTCCEKKCRVFAEDQLLQLGYDGAGQAIVFDPEWRDDGIGFPLTGQQIDDRCFASLTLLTIAHKTKAEAKAEPIPEHLH